MVTEVVEGRLDYVAERLVRARRVLFITGAGLSADSGLPTYRGIGGLYQGQDTVDGMPIETALSGATFKRSPEITWKYLRQVETVCRGARPNAAHRAIAELQSRIEYVLVLTQNVDGLQRAAGSRNLVEIHGDLREIICTVCGDRRSVDSYLGLANVPRCVRCNGIERPNVVLFGEMLPEGKIESVLKQVWYGFDVVVSIGSTGVFPYIRLPMMRARDNGWLGVDINPEYNELTKLAQVWLPTRACDAMTALMNRLG